MEQVNPYEAPKAQLADLEETPGKLYLASRLDRFWASLVDGVLVIPMYLFLGAGIAAFGEPVPEVGLIWLAALGCVGLGILALQLTLLHSNGWTVGKRLMKIRIVRVDGTRAGLARIFWLRMAPMNVIALVPIVSLVTMVDPLFIFGRERRCLHDWIAGTKVVNARTRTQIGRRRRAPSVKEPVA